MEPIASFCTRCRKSRPIDDFDVNKQDIMKNLCSRHSKKKKMPSLDSLGLWDDFLQEINAWSRPVNINPINFLDEKILINSVSSLELNF